MDIRYQKSKSEYKISKFKNVIKYKKSINGYKI